MKFIALALLFLTACQTVQQPAPQAPAPVVQPAPAPLPALSLAWEKSHPERVDWSKELRAQIVAKLPILVKASDWESYCKGFSSKSQDQQVDALATMAVAITLYESDYNPKAISPDDVDGTASIGLFQLSYEDNMKWCSMSKTKGNLVDAIVNIDCAIPEMSLLISQDGVVAAGQARGTRKGLARYWSTMWPGGHLGDIKKAVQSLAFCH